MGGPLSLHWLPSFLTSLMQETQGVCVAAFGESREFPAFFSRQSGFKAPYHVQDEEEAAKLIGVFQQRKVHVWPWNRGSQKWNLCCLFLKVFASYHTDSKELGGYKPIASWKRTCPWVSQEQVLQPCMFTQPAPTLLCPFPSAFHVPEESR